MASDDDVPFLLEMLYQSIFVPGGEMPPPRSVLKEHAIAHYLEGFGRDGDFALIAVLDGQDVGAAWYRLFSSDDPGYGYVADDIPELGIAVLPEVRGRGVGTRLLVGLVDAARKNGFRALSLSVQPDNPARRLYERLGFVRTGACDDAWTFVKGLGARSA